MYNNLIGPYSRDVYVTHDTHFTFDIFPNDSRLEEVLMLRSRIPHTTHTMEHRITTGRRFHFLLKKKSSLPITNEPNKVSFVRFFHHHSPCEFRRRLCASGPISYIRDLRVFIKFSIMNIINELKSDLSNVFEKWINSKRCPFDNRAFLNIVKGF